MFNLLRMDMYQIFKGSLFKIFTALIIIFTVGSVFMSWLVETPAFQEWTGQVVAQNVSEPEYADTSGESTGAETSEAPASHSEESQPTQLQLLASLLVNNGLLSLLVVLYIAVVITDEHKSGYIKNILTARVSRASYFISKAVSIVVVSSVLTLVGVFSALIAFALFGLPLSASTIGEMVVWTLCVIGLLSAMSMLVALVAWATRSKVFSVVFGIVIVSGLLVGLLSSWLSPFPAIAELLTYSMSATFSSLGYGLSAGVAFDLPRIVGVAVGFFILYGLLSYASIRKRDV